MLPTITIALNIWISTFCRVLESLVIVQDYHLYSQADTYSWRTLCTTSAFINESTETACRVKRQKEAFKTKVMSPKWCWKEVHRKKTGILP